MAPPAPNQVPRLMGQLCAWLKATDAHPLRASSAFHYDFEFIHPFSHGRMGRLWQTLILSQWQPVLAFLPVEMVIKRHQAEYYSAFRHADSKSNCTEFIEFLLDAFNKVLAEAIASSQHTRLETQVKTLVETRVEIPSKTPQQILKLLEVQPELSIA